MGCADPRTRVVGTGRFAWTSTWTGPVDRWVQSACVLCSHGCALDIGVRDGRIVGVRGRGVRPRQPRPARAEGPLRLAGEQRRRPAATPARAPRRRAAARRAGTRRWTSSSSARASCSRRRAAARSASTRPASCSSRTTTRWRSSRAAGSGRTTSTATRGCAPRRPGSRSRRRSAATASPAGVHDIEFCDTILHVGINTAETQTVLWMHELDRLRGPDPPRSIVIDPRETESAREAEVHLAIKPGTNLAVLNGLAQQLIENGCDRPRVRRAAHGRLRRARADRRRRTRRSASRRSAASRPTTCAARPTILGEAERLLTFVLQGVYQSHQATASACAANNINLLRGMIGKPGAGILQMNGQPTAQNTRETGCNGDLPGFRNWQNEAHVAELARALERRAAADPALGPADARDGDLPLCRAGLDRVPLGDRDQPCRLAARACGGSARSSRRRVSSSSSPTPSSARRRDSPTSCSPPRCGARRRGRSRTPTAPCTSPSRPLTPPGEARPDMEIFLDYARRLDLRDKDGQPLVKWSTPEECFEAWKECTRGRPCDYTGLSYDKLRGGSGIQWPCNEEAPDGTERLYEDLTFPTHPRDLRGLRPRPADGRDALRGRLQGARAAGGRAILKAAEWTPPHEWARDEYPFALATGRTVYHFHTRTKTGRAPELQAAAPDAWVELSAVDAERLGVAEGDLLRVTSPRGSVEVAGPGRRAARRGRLRPVPLRLLGRRRRRRP